MSLHSHQYIDQQVGLPVAGESCYGRPVAPQRFANHSEGTQVEVKTP